MLLRNFIFLIKPIFTKTSENFQFLGIKKYILCFFLFYKFSLKLLNFNILNISNTSLFFFSNLYQKKDLLKYFFNFIYLKIKGVNQGFFFRFRIVGLGFKIKRLYLSTKVRFLRVEVGYSHIILFKISNDVRFYIKKKSFLLFSLNFHQLKNISIRLRNFRKLNYYKEKGILYLTEVLKLKSGKQQQR